MTALEPGTKYGLYLANADGDILRLTSDGPNKDGPRWAPDGRTIVFTQNREGYLRLHPIDLESRAIAQLSDSQVNEWQPSFSLDGKQIIFTRSRDRSVQLDIWIMDSDGKNPRPVAAAHGQEELAIPRFSPDRRRIAFQSRQNGQLDICVIKQDGSGQTQLMFAGGGFPN